MNKQTLRLVVPDWQAGNNPIYALGAKILAAIAPENPHQETLTIDVPNIAEKLSQENNVNGQHIIKNTLLKTKDAINSASPARIITLGGNCLVSQAPIDYLNGKYDDLGVIWVDAHPDISTPEIFENEHAMVLGNLLKKGDPVFNNLVDHPLHPNQIFYAGLQEPTTIEKHLLQNDNLEYQHHAKLSIDEVKAWIKQNNFTHLYIHFDIDVLNPRNFYATYFNNPQLTAIPENAAMGQTNVPETWTFLKVLNQEFNLVGLTIAEYMPWSAQQLVNLINGLEIFK